jgi:rhodanese-related sulfurtransferase
MAVSAFTVGVIYNQFQPSGVALGGFQTRTVADASPQSEGYSIVRMKRIVETGEALIVDARPQEQYLQGHIPGAINLPANEFSTSFSRHESDLRAASDRGIVVYCSSRTCGASEKLVRELRQHGFQNLAVFSGGWDTWIANQLPEMR